VLLLSSLLAVLAFGGWWVQLVMMTIFRLLQMVWVDPSTVIPLIHHWLLKMLLQELLVSSQEVSKVQVGLYLSCLVLSLLIATSSLSHTRIANCECPSPHKKALQTPDFRN
jgi:hypothetical protein